MFLPSPRAGDPASEIWSELPQSSPMQTQTGRLEETRCGKFTGRNHIQIQVKCVIFFPPPIFPLGTLFPGEEDLRERLKCVFQDITQKLDDPEFGDSISSFVKAYEAMKADGEVSAALSSFGESVRAEATGCKRQRGSEPAGVQLTAVLRSDACLDGEGGLIMGRPSKISKPEHVYVKALGNPSPEFHATIQCVEESVCLEGNQLEIHTLPF